MVLFSGRQHISASGRFSVSSVTFRKKLFQSCHVFPERQALPNAALIRSWASLLLPVIAVRAALFLISSMVYKIFLHLFLLNPTAGTCFELKKSLCRPPSLGCMHSGINCFFLTPARCLSPKEFRSNIAKGMHLVPAWSCMVCKQQWAVLPGFPT